LNIINPYMDLAMMSLTRQRDRLAVNPAAAAELIDACYHKIERLNPVLNAFITVIPPSDLPETRPGGMPSLSGIPIAVKDLYNTQGIRTTAGSRFFTDFIPEEDAFTVTKVRQAGGRIVGKTNTHEIALGVTNNNPHFGACKNPWDITRTPGGSSGGSAAAVASGMALAALGTDTGGSIRIPASLCGVTGLKPTYGRVSLRGILPLSWNLDHAGPITRSAEDAALMLQVIGGYDEADPASVKTLPGDYLSHIADGMRDRKLALGVGEFIEGAEDDVLQAVREAVRVFRDLGASFSEVNLDYLRQAAQANGVMTQADGAAFHRERLRDHPDWFGEDVRQRLEAGAAYTSTEYILARRTQAETRRRLERLFDEYDSLLLPTTPITAPLLEGENALERARILTKYTAPFNLSGLPALSIPCGFDSNGLPIGLQVVSRAWNEAGVLRAGYAYQLVTDWHLSGPPKLTN